MEEAIQKALGEKNFEEAKKMYLKGIEEKLTNIIEPKVMGEAKNTLVKMKLIDK